MGMMHRGLYEIVMRGRARRPYREHEDPREDMAEAAKRRTRLTRYPGDLDAPKREDPQNRNRISKE